MNRRAHFGGLVLPTVLWAAGLASGAEPDALQPLDTRTRCIVLFRETMIHVSHADVEGVLKNVADGTENGFELFPQGASQESAFASEAKHPAKFFRQNFPEAKAMSKRFHEMRFGEMKTESRTERIVEDASDSERMVQMHVIPVALPGLDTDLRQLRFIEVAGRLYWIPPGW